MRCALSILAALGPAGPLVAEPWTCSFTVECVAGEACGESAFDARILPADHAGDLFLTSVTGDSPLARLTEAAPCPPPMRARASTGWPSF
ncbi:MAG: hypothetical protein ACOCYW_03245 [Roseicyclus sp.]